VDRNRDRDRDRDKHREKDRDRDKIINARHERENAAGVSGNQMENESARMQKCKQHFRKSK